MTKQTALDTAHRLLHARMTDFHGWELPLHYGSQIEEHNAVRRDCGMFDISHMGIVDVAGTDAQAFLLRLLANSVAKLRQAGRALYSCMLNEPGGVLDDLIIYLLGDGRYRLVVNAATADNDLAWMSVCAGRWNMAVSVTPRRDLAMIAIQGPAARAKACLAIPQAEAAIIGLDPFFAFTTGDYFIARTGYTGEDGLEISLPAGQAEALWQALLRVKVQPCGLGARDTLRLEAGLCLYGQDMDESVTPLEAGLGWTVDFAAGRDFVGKEALLARPRRWQLFGLVLDGGGVLRAGQQVDTLHGEGAVTSGTFSPTMQQSIALARLPPEVVHGEAVEVEIRGKRHAALVVKPPFVRNGRILV